MKNALADTMSALPKELARLLSWDRGKEMSARAKLNINPGIPVFFADPQSLWQRGTNENTNGLLGWSTRASTSPNRAPTGSKPSPTHPILGPATPSAGRPQKTHSTSSYRYSNKPVLHPLAESRHFRSRAFVKALADNGMKGSMGKIGACADKAVMESFSALLQKNVLNQHRWSTKQELRLAMVPWIERSDHRGGHQRRLGRLTLIEFKIMDGMTAPVA